MLESNLYILTVIFEQLVVYNIYSVDPGRGIKYQREINETIKTFSINPIIIQRQLQ